MFAGDYAILSFSGFLGLGDRQFCSPLTYARIAVLDIDKDRLRYAPGFEKDNWPSWDSQIYRHYEYEPYWGGTTQRPEQPQQNR